MTPEAQRIAIAEACGAQWGPVEFLGGTRVTLSFNKHVELGVMRWELRDGRTLADDIPDYLNDLNAIHNVINQQCELEGFPFQEGYTRELRAGVTRIRRDLNEMQVDYWMAQATAAQRAEAFLRTLGKREDDK